MRLPVVPDGRDKAKAGMLSQYWIFILFSWAGTLPFLRIYNIWFLYFLSFYIFQVVKAISNV